MGGTQQTDRDAGMSAPENRQSAQKTANVGRADEKNKANSSRTEGSAAL